MKFHKSFHLLFVILFFGQYLQAQKGWTLQKEKDGIRISSRHSSTSPFSDIRVELDIPGNIDQFASILQDVDGYKQWSYATKISKLVTRLGPSTLIYYTEIEVPWPATNRCFYANFNLKKDAANQTLQVTAVNLPDYRPISKDLVQVPMTNATWNVTTISKKIIHVDYILQLNPGGSLPAWMLNLFSTKAPMESFENIKQKMTALNPL